MRISWRFLVPAFFILSTLLYIRCLDNPFLMDDESQITDNHIVQDLSQWPHYFTSSTMGGGGPQRMAGIYYKPIMTTFYALAWHFFGDDPAAFRVPLIVLHTLNGLLLVDLFTVFFPAALAVLAGLIFLVHPINTEIVVYIANAQDALYLFFGLLAFFCIRHVRRPRLKPWLMGLCLVAALLSKETGALFLFLVPIFAFFFERPFFKASVLVSFITGSLYSMVRLSIGLTRVIDADLLLHRASYSERLLTVPSAVWHYFEEYFFGLHSSLTRDYVVREPSVEHFWGPLLGLALLLAGWVWIMSKVRKTSRWPGGAFFSAILLLWLALHGQVFVPLDGTVADRWFYLGQIGALGFLMLAFLEVPKPGSEIPRPWRLGGALMAVALLALCFARTWQRIGDWANPLSLYSIEFERFPDSAIMANNVGVELFRAGRKAESKPFFEKSVELNPLWVISINNLGAAEEHAGNFERAMQLYARAVEIGTYSLAYENYANLLCRYLPMEPLGRTRQMAACKEFLKDRALTLYPKNARLLQLASEFLR